MQMGARKAASLVAAVSLLMACAVMACGRKEASVTRAGMPAARALTAAKTRSVFVSIFPQKYFVERVGGEHVSVQLLVKPGESPHSYEPTPKQTMALGGSDAYFTLGFPFEEHLVEKIKAGSPDLVIIASDRGIRRRALEELQHHEGEHGGGLDPHVWLSSDEIRIQVYNIYQGLVKIDPSHAGDYSRNLEVFLADLDRIDKRIAHILEPYRGQSIMVFHPAFGYFTDHYGLKQIPIEIDGKSPTPKQLEHLIEEAREQDVRIIFVQPQFDRKAAETVAKAIDGVVVPMNPLAADVLKNLEEMASKIEAALK
jgi:zinc transport system substrate-binding protein